MTDSERLLWSRIRRKQLNGYRVYRRKVIGNNIVDFYCPVVKIIVELDGSQHTGKSQTQRDRKRNIHLSELGFEVTRFWSWEVMKNVDEIVDAL